MGIFAKIFFLSSAVSIVLVGLFLHNIGKSLDVPAMEEKYWGPGNPPAKQKTDIVPFKIQFSDEMIKDLKQRLANTRYTPPLEGIAQEYGFNSNLLKEIVTFWQTKYPFKEREAFLNKYPHFKTNIQGLDIHYMHIKPKDTKGVTVLPLLLLHGWPGSFREFYDIIPLLTTKNPNHNFVFEVIAPSLPGFAYSQAAAKPGCGAHEMAVIMKNLMLRLGHQKFYLQGGDWGSVAGALLAALYREHVLGLHCNFCMVVTPLAYIKRLAGSFYPRAIVDEKYENRYYPLSTRFKFMALESGYFHLQATKPDTVGTGLNDSPAGLAAYILEKFSTGTNGTFVNIPDGGLKSTFKYEDLLDNLMIYWITNSVTSAMRIYSEIDLNLDRVPIVVPSACANFRHELIYEPESVLRDRYVNLVQNTHYDIGGHFIAMQLPHVLAEDFFSAVEKMEQLHKEKSSST